MGLEVLMLRQPAPELDSLRARDCLLTRQSLPPYALGLASLRARKEHAGKICCGDNVPIWAYALEAAYSAESFLATSNGACS